MTNRWMPEIFYEEGNEGLTGGFPFMRIPDDKDIPSSLFIGASKKIMEEGEEVHELIMQMYVNSETLKSVLSAEEYDRVRVALGLKPLQEALDSSVDYQEKVDNLEQQSVNN
jgi:hypothetical protein